MFFRSDEIEEDLKCAFCKQKFVDVIKLIPSCGESICGDCYDELKENSDSKSEFKCKACEKTHKIPEDGLTDNRGLSRMLKRRKVEKPLTKEAEDLRKCMESLPNQLMGLEAFDDRVYIHDYCDRLEFEIIEDIDSLVKILNDIQKKLLEQTGEYRKQCLDSLSSRTSAKAENDRNEELQAFSKEIIEFNHHWREFLNQVEANLSHKEIEDALSMAREYEERICAFDRKLKRNALNDQVMEFKASHSFLGDPSPLRKLFCLPIRDSNAEDLKIEPTPLRTLKGHSDEISQVIFLSDNKLASCSDDKTIKVWNAENGALLFELKGHTDCVNSLVLLNDSWLASCSEDTNIKLWDLVQKREIRNIKGHTQPVVSLQVLKNGHLASYAIDDTIRVWNPFASENNHLLLTIEGHGNTNWQIPFGVLSNDNLVTVSCGRDSQEECTLRVWNSKDGQLVKAIPTGFRGARTMAVYSIDQVAVSFNNGILKVIDLKDDSKSLTKRGIHVVITSLLQLSNGNLLSTDRTSDSDDKSKLISMVKIWKRDSFDLLQTIKTDHSHQILSAVTSPNGKLMATAGRDQIIKLWSVNSI